MATYRVMLLGQPSFQGPGGPVRLTAVKGGALLWYIASQPDRLFSRSHLAGLLWENNDEAGGRNTLSTTLTRLRQALPAWPLRLVGDGIGWDPRADLQIDATRFMDLTRPGPGADAEVRDALAAAVALWRGPFLDGFALPDSEGYEQWLEQERQQWERRVLDTLARLIEADEMVGAWADLARHAQQGLAVDPLQERFHRWLMLAYHRLGDRSAALAQYAACQRILDDELGIAPDAATRALRDAITAGRVPSGAGGAAVGAGAAAGAGISPGSAAQSPVTPRMPQLVGRDADLETLEAALARAGASEGRVILVRGEAGIGKSRAVAEVTRRLQEQQGAGRGCRTLLSGHCYESAVGLPYAPFVEALRGVLLTVDVTHLPVPAVWLAELNRLLPDLSLLRADLPTPPALDPGQERRRLFEGVARFLSALPRPVILVLEDLHWADEATMLLLAYLARQPLTRGIALLCTARTGDLPADVDLLLHQLEREGVLVWHDLGRLGPADVATLARSLASQAGAALGEQLYELTQGNALFAVELLRAVAEGGSLHIADTAFLHHVPVPRTVQAVIKGRLARRSPQCRDLVAAAAIFPRSAPLQVLQQVAGLPEEAAVLALEELIEADVLHELREGGAAAPSRPGARWSVEVAFRHDLVRRVVYGGLSQSRLRTMHRLAYRALADLVPGGPDQPALAAEAALAEQLAYHAAAGELWQQGLGWSREAAGGALRVFAYPAVTRFLEQALVCLSRLPATAGLRRQAVDIRLQLGQVAMYFQPHRLEEWLAPAAAEATALGDEVRLARVWLAQASAMYIQGRLGAALPMLEQMLPVARAAGSDDLLAPCLTVLGEVLSARGAFDQAIRLLEEAVPLLSRMGNHLEAMVARNFVGGVLAYQGHFVRADEILAATERESGALGGHAAMASALGFTACAAQMQGNWKRAVAAGREAIRQARQVENPVHQYVAGVFLGLALARLGNVPGALEAQQQAIALAQMLHTQIILGLAYGRLGEIHLAANQPAEAATAARTGLDIATAEGARFDAAVCTRVLGESAARRARFAEARDDLLGALSAFTALGAHPEAARCHAALACLPADALPSAESLRHRRQAEDLFRSMGMDWDLQVLAET